MDDLQQTQEQIAMVNLVRNWYSNSKSAYADRKAIIEKCYEAYKKSYEDKKKTRTKANSRRNYIFASVEDALALLTDGKPALDCWPRTRDDVGLAEKGKQVLDWIWEVTEMNSKLEIAERDHLISGLGWLKIYFDPMINYPHGEIVVDVVHPLHLWPDPDATSHKTCRYMIQETDAPLWMIRKIFPKLGKYVKGDESISVNNQDKISTETAREYFSADVTSEAVHYRAKMLECWMKDDSVYEKEERDELGNVTREEGALKYPNGKKVVIAGDIWLNPDDCHNPFEDGEFPYVMVPNYLQSDSFFPQGDVEYLIEINNDINKIVSRLNDYIRHTCHTTIVYDDECNIKEDTLENLEAALVKKNKGGDFTVNAPPPWPQSIFQWLDTCKSDLEIISGIREVLQGRPASSGQSGVALGKLQEFALARIRKKARNVDVAIKQVGEKFISRMKQYYTDTRQIRITGDFPVKAQQPEPGTGIMDPMGQDVVTGSRRYDFIEFSNQEFYPNSQYNPEQQMYLQDTGEVDETGQPVMAPAESVQLDIILEVGAAASVSRNQERQDSEFLLRSGVIDQEEIARRYGIKNYQEIKARMEQNAMKQAQMAQQMGGNMQVQ